MNTRTSSRNHKVVFVQGNIFDFELQTTMKPDILGPFVHTGYCDQSCTFDNGRQKEAFCPVKPYISRSPILEADAERIICKHLDSLIEEGARRIAICPPGLDVLQGLEADRYYMEIIYRWIEKHDSDIECLFVIDKSTTTNITVEEV